MRRSLALRLGLAGFFMASALALSAHPAFAAYQAKVQSGTLKITGDSASDKLSFGLQPGSPATLLVDVGEDGTTDFSFDRPAFTAISVDAGAGDDEVRVVRLGGSLADVPVTINGGAGSDTLLGGDDGETLLGGTGNDFVDGNRGNDTASLGGGDDTFQWDPGDGSDAVGGQGGDDRLAFNGSNIGEHIGIAPAADGHVLFTRDVAAISMNLDGVERLGFTALGGADTVTVDDLAGTDAKTVDVDLNATGGGGDGAADTVIARGTDAADRVSFTSPDGRPVVNGIGAQTRVAGGEAALDSLVVQTLGGADSASSNVGVTSPIPLHVDGGEGLDTATFSGSSAADTIGIANNGTEVATFTPGGAIFGTAVESLLVQGLAGDDTILGQNGISTLTALTIDGGDGNDTLGGGDGDDLVLGGRGDDHLDGNRGTDTVLGGGGDDTFEWDPGDGSDTLEGQGGSDRLAFNGSNIGEQIDLSANGPRLRLFRNVAAITQDAAGIESVDVETLGGADAVTVGNLAGTDVRTVDVDLNTLGGLGDGSADTVTAVGTDGGEAVTLSNADGRLVVGGFAAQTRVLGGEAALDRISVAGLGGDDTITTTPLVTGTAPVSFDGGEGTDTARFVGTPGDDQLGVARDAAGQAAFAPGSAVLETTATDESLLVQGLGGNDTLTGQNGIAGLTPVTYDGGDGEDTVLGGDGDDLLLGGKGDDLVDGNRGTDTELGGPGNDTFQWDPGDGSDTLEGQVGDDTLAFNGSNIGEQIDLSANGPRVRLFRNVGAVTQDFDGIEHANVRALGGADAITVGDLTGTAVDTVGIDLSATQGGGDGSADTVTVNGTPRKDTVNVTLDGPAATVAGLPAIVKVTGSEPALDQLVVNTLDGVDSVFVAPEVAGVIQTLVNLGNQ